MEVEEAVEGGEEMFPQNKKICLVVAPENERSLNSSVDGNVSEQTASVLLYSSSGQLVRAEIVVDNQNENIVAVPLESDAPKRSKPFPLCDDGTEVLRILETPRETQKKPNTSQFLSMRTVERIASQHEGAVTKIVRSSKHARQKQVSPHSTARSLRMPAKTQSRVSALCTKVGIPTDEEQSSFQENHPPLKKVAIAKPAVEVKAELSGISEEQLPDITSAIDTAVSHGDFVEDESGCDQTVMMRLNSLAPGLELDPAFLASDTITDTQPEFESTNRSGGACLKKGQMHLQSSAASEAEAGNINVNQSWFTSREDKAMLRWRGHAWRQGMWSREETDTLQQNIEQYCAQRGVSDPSSVIFKMSKEERSGFYRVIAKGLNRPLFSIYRRVVRLYDNHNHIGKYSSEEVSKLRELHLKHGNNWQAIAAHLGRSAASVKDRCRLLKEHCNRGTWSTEEEDRLATAVYNLAQVLPGEQVTSGISWGEVASKVRTRSEKQCRTKWLNYLNWKRTSGVEWGKADDVQLICRLSVCGAGDESQVDWTVLAQAWPACRSPHWLRGKWWNLKKRLPHAVQEMRLADMVVNLYNLQPISLLQSTLVELLATFLNSQSPASPTSSSNDTLTNHSLKSSSPGQSSHQDSSSLAMGTIKLCIPAANFSQIINSDDREDFHSKLNSLVQSALLTSSVEVHSCNSDTAVIESLSPDKLETIDILETAQLTHSLESGLPVSNKAQTIIVRADEPRKEESLLRLQLSPLSRAGMSRVSLLGQGCLEGLVKEEDILSDSEGGHTTTLDSSSVVRSKLILNDPILSVSGDPLGSEEGLQADPDDPHICSGLAGD